ncbi:GntR family transcriptional regulator [Catenulispora sp. NF23]|uniref:GntR family transcriptional regulator n=1 Tax=Catenulispora pinistramenti TaxID=2705254 RepID=UPI001BAC5FD3|nr:GntR family transcriptional regulator [Catenulispora pinistramenti]MBS2539265.1 GntR family transcriptional regulator [Catenulispora pinistramenti]
MSGTYLTIADALRGEIAAMPAGTRLKSEVELVARFKVARETIRRALAVLEDEGAFVTEHGRGRFVGSAPADLPLNLAAIVAELEGGLKAGEFTKGELFYSESQLGRDRSLSRHDARRVLIALEQRGLLEPRPGKGRYVV